jgi:hypothetical protein
MYFPQPRGQPRKDAEWNHLEGIWQPVRKVERFRTDCRLAVWQATSYATEAIGTRVTYRYQEKTLAGKPRHPVFERICPDE